MAMGEELRSKKSGRAISEAVAGSPASPDSGSTGARSQGGGVWVNDRGETCYGNDCFTLAVDEQRREIRLNIKRDSGACAIDPIVTALKNTLGKGAKTVYEVETEFK